SAEEGAGNERVKDVVVVGAGIGGLTAAWQLRDLDTIVLEMDDRVGGRIKSVERGSHWVSVGAHMFPGEGSLLWSLLEELALERETASDVRRRLLGFLDDRTWAQYIGAVHPQVEAIFRATANRLTAEPDEVAAGCMVGLFAHVWEASGVVLGYNLRSGPSSLPEELARRLGERVVTGAPVTRVAREPDGVRVRFHRG